MEKKINFCLLSNQIKIFEIDEDIMKDLEEIHVGKISTNTRKTVQRLTVNDNKSYNINFSKENEKQSSKRRAMRLQMVQLIQNSGAGYFDVDEHMNEICIL